MRHRSQTSVLAILTAVACLSAGPGGANASEATAAKTTTQPGAKTSPSGDKSPLTAKQLEFAADEVIYDKDLNSVTAQGHVEIHRDNNTLKANTVTYNLTTGTVTANGNVTRHRQDGQHALRQCHGTRRRVTERLHPGRSHRLQRQFSRRGD